MAWGTFIEKWQDKGQPPEQARVRFSNVFIKGAQGWMSDNDLQALAAAAQDRPSLEEVLPSMTIPCLLFVGEATQCIL